MLRFLFPLHFLGKREAWPLTAVIFTLILLTRNIFLRSFIKYIIFSVNKKKVIAMTQYIRTKIILDDHKRVQLVKP